MNTAKDHKLDALRHPAELVFRGPRAIILALLIVFSLWTLTGPEDASAQVLLWNGDEDCSQISNFQDQINCKLDTNKAVLDEILGEVTDAYFEISAELCMEIAPATFGAAVGIGATIAGVFEASAGVDFYGNEATAGGAIEAFFEESLAYEPSFTLASLTICGSPAPIQLDSADANLGKMRQNDVTEFLTSYQNENSDIVADVGNAIPNPAILMPAGQHHITWNARNELGRSVMSGVYLYELRTPTERQIKQLILIK